MTPPQIGPWWKVSLMDASHFDAKSAYAAVNTIRLDDLRPHIYRTRDEGKTWQEITNGIPADENVNVVREDPQRRGLLFAGTERGVYVSYDDGDHWQSLRLNLPATSVRDLIVKDDDLAIATHGRGFWILDNITALRQIQPNEKTTLLFKPQTALRVRWNSNTDTPAPAGRTGRRKPAGRRDDRLFVRRTDQRPGHARDQGRQGRGGASLCEQRSGAAGRSEAENPALLGAAAAGPFGQAGLASLLLGHARDAVAGHGTVIPDDRDLSAKPRRNRPRPGRLPGNYSVVLTAGGKSFTQPLTLKMDPRLKVTDAELTKQFELSKRLQDLRAELAPIGKSYEALAGELKKAKERAGEKAEVQETIKNLRT